MKIDAELHRRVREYARSTKNPVCSCANCVVAHGFKLNVAAIDLASFVAARVKKERRKP